MLIGKRAIVTGASKGIGLAISERLAQLGCAVTMVSRDQDVLYDKVKELPRDENQDHKYISYDLLNLARGEEPDNHSFLIEALKTSNILVNCAGMSTHTMLAKAIDDSVRETIGLNLLAPILLSKLAIKPMLKLAKLQETRPTILNVSSMLSLTGLAAPGTTVYAALKAGLLGFTQSLAYELNGKIRVNAILPSLVTETDMGRLAALQGRFPTIPLQVVADASVDLICDDSLNGKLMVADGLQFTAMN